MLGQILLTAAVVTIAYLVLRSRRAGVQERVPPRRQQRAVRLPPRLAQSLAYGLVALLVVGTGYYLIERWAEAREIVVVEVVNANTGRTTFYEARRGSVKGRGFVTLDGQRVRLAEVERMVLRDAAAPSVRVPWLGEEQ